MGFPEELKQRKIWVCWRIEPSKDKDKDKDRKVPYNPATGKPAQSNAPATWGTYEQAADACERFTYSGLGYMFEEGSGIVGVDIDHCYDKDTKQFNEVAQAVMQKQPTYMEFSPSGTGIHLLYRGTKPDGACKNSDMGVEMYDSKRYFTMTGNQVAGTPDEIADDAGTLQWIHSTYIQKPKQKNTEPKKTKKKAHIVGEPLTDEEVIEKACGAADNGLFVALYDGKWEDKYGSQSEADMALCIKLAFWTGKNKEQMDRLFRSSKLFRPKWDESHRSDGTTYGEETLSKAIEAQESVYAVDKDSSIFEYVGCYFRAKGEQIYPLTNFILRPIEMIEAEDETKITAELVTASGSYVRSMMSTEFSSAQKFKGILNKTGIELGYFGGDADLELLKIYLSSLDWKRRTGIKVAGIHSHGGQCIFVSGDLAVNKAGEAVEDILQIERCREIESTMLKTDPITADKLMCLGQNILSYNEPAKTVPIMAWAAGCFVKEHLREKSIKYPLLFLVGEAGSGKSTTMERVLMPIFSETKVYAASQLTKFSLLYASASSNLCPMFLDEFKPSKMDKAHIGALYNHFRDTYDGHEGCRGRMDQTMVGYELLAPMTIAGEESAEEAAIRERSIELLFSKKDLKNEAYRSAFGKIAKNKELLQDFGRSLLMTALSTDPDTVAGWHEEAGNLFDKNLPERVLTNLCSAYCGLKLIEALCGKLTVDWNAVFPHTLDICSKYLEASAKEFLLDGGTHNQSVVDETFEIMSRMRLDPKNDYQLSDNGKVMYIRLPKVYDEYTRYRKDYAISGEVLAYKEFKRQLQHSDIFMASNMTRRMGDSPAKVWMLRYDVLSQRCDVSGFQSDDVKPLV